MNLNGLNNYDVGHESLKINTETNEDTFDTQYSAMQQRIKLINMAPENADQKSVNVTETQINSQRSDDLPATTMIASSPVAVD